MKSSSIMLSVDSPCNESWDNMEQKGKDKFCDQCTKQVYDFTHYGDEELIRFFSKNRETVCGRFLSSQQNRNLINSSPSRTPNKSFPKIVASILLLSISPFSHSTILPYPITIKSSPLATKKLTQKEGPNLVIKGQVYDIDNQETLIGASVIIKKLLRGASTDLEGNFDITLPDSLVNDSIQIEVSFIGYTTQTLTYKKNAIPDHIQINMRVDTSTTLPDNKMFILGSCKPVEKLYLNTTLTGKSHKWWKFWRKRAE